MPIVQTLQSGVSPHRRDQVKREVIAIIGAGGIGMAIARRQGFGRTVLLADRNEQTLATAVQSMRDAGYAAEAQVVDVTARASVKALADRAAALGAVTQVVNTAGVSPNMAPVEGVLKVDLYGAAVVFDEFGRVIAPGGAGLIISSMAGHMMPALPPEQDLALMQTPTDELLALSFLQPALIPNPVLAYMIAKRANHLRVQAEAMRWGKRGARVNAISPGIIVTPLALHELNSPIGGMYRSMIDASPAGRMAPPDEIAIAASFLLGTDAGFVTGSDLLIDGGVIAAMKTGALKAPE
jgi:NAD(P)-dependent dehydrogenase (short-subunit alcohol dehydrogenase family)